jgi:hypothetical protein
MQIFIRVAESRTGIKRADIIASCMQILSEQLRAAQRKSMRTH